MRRTILPLALLVALILFLTFRLAAETGFLADRLIKDPERAIPPGEGIVSPADGTVLYVRRFENGQVPLVIKQRAEIPIEELTRLDPPPRSGVVIGIYMNTYGVHVNRAPIAGKVQARQWYNG